MWSDRKLHGLFYNLSTLPFEYLLIAGIFLYIPAVIQTKVQIRSFKLTARTSLGISVIFLAYTGLLLTPWSFAEIILRFGFLGVFLAVLQITLRLREHYSKSPCDRCPEGRFPICSYTNNHIQRLSDLHFQNSESNNPEMDSIVEAFKNLSNYDTLRDARAR
jgi:hypothetical protein